MEQQETLTVNKETIKALSVDTRVKILKILSNKQQTLSDLANMTGLSVPTIKEHLEILETAELIKKIEEGRKWKYYHITEKGKGILYPETRRIWIALSLLGLSAVSVTIALVSMLNQKVSSLVAPRSAAMYESAQDTALKATAAAAAPIQQSFPLLPTIFFGVSVALLIIAIIYLLWDRKRKFNNKIRKIK
jgi:DNA-binding transcriptional ArsR family regulator